MMGENTGDPAVPLNQNEAGKKIEDYTSALCVCRFAVSQPRRETVQQALNWRRIT